MEKYFFDSKDLSFYPLSLKDSYVAAGTWPENMVEVEELKYHEFISGKEGYQLTASKKGDPTWRKVVKTEEASKKEVDREVSKRLDSALSQTKILEYSEQLDMISEDEKSRLAELKKYIVLLSKISTQEGYPSSVEWPKEPK